MVKNISVFDTFSMHARYLYNKMVDFNNLRTLLKNWYSVVLFRFGLFKNVCLIFRDGYSLKVHNKKDYNAFWDSKKGQMYIAQLYEYDRNIRIYSKLIKLKFGPKKIKFVYKDQIQLRNIFGTIKENFVDEQFKRLRVKNADVVDIGANVGDTAIYFALRGAKHVYAFEPYPYSYKLAVENIKVNKLNDRITIRNNGIGSKKDKITIDPNFKNTAGTKLKTFKVGIHINVITLSDIVLNHKIKNAILKIDCEGCEYGVILDSDNEVLRKFTQIMIEYHYGYENLEKKLKEAGFFVEHTNPILMYNNDTEKKMILGMIYASKERKFYTFA